MKESLLETERLQSRGEEIANSISHGFGFLAALAGSPWLIVFASRHGGLWPLVGAAVFIVATLLLYLASTLYHAFPHGWSAKRWFGVVDHAAIFLLIAGTYTPFTLGILQGAWGWSIFGVIWGLAIAGVLLKLFRGVDRHRKLSLCLYLGMGWLILVAARLLWLRMPVPGLTLLVCGGIAYSLGVPFYAATRVRYFHFVWHLFVLAGTSCHFLAVMWYAN